MLGANEEDFGGDGWWLQMTGRGRARTRHSDGLEINRSVGQSVGESGRRQAERFQASWRRRQ